MINIDESLFLKDFKTFEEHLLPIVNDERTASGLAALSEQEATDYYLDLLNEYRDAVPDGGADKGTS